MYIYVSLVLTNRCIFIDSLSISEMIYKKNECNMIESTKTTSMEDVSTGVLEKKKEYLRSKDKIDTILQNEPIWYM